MKGWKLLRIGSHFLFFDCSLDLIVCLFIFFLFHLQKSHPTLSPAMLLLKRASMLKKFMTCSLKLAGNYTQMNDSDGFPVSLFRYTKKSYFQLLPYIPPSNSLALLKNKPRLFLIICHINTQILCVFSLLNANDFQNLFFCISVWNNCWIM